MVPRAIHRMLVWDSFQVLLMSMPVDQYKAVRHRACHLDPVQQQ